MNKFKVGDRVEIVLRDNYNVTGHYPYGAKDKNKGLCIVELSWDDTRFAVYDVDGNYVGIFKNHELKLVTNNKTNMSNIKTFVKNLALSADEKLLRKHGLKSDCGEYTDEAKEIVINELCKEKEAKLIEIAKGLEAEEK